jgi:hypothetical protein
MIVIDYLPASKRKRISYCCRLLYDCSVALLVVVAVFPVVEEN